MSWYSLTPRQQELDRAIERSGIKLDNSPRCLKKAMRYIGAHDSEKDYVAERIALRICAKQMIEDADDVIARAEDLLKRL